MNGRMLSQVMLCFLVLTLVACGTPAAVPPTATPVPPTNTPIPSTFTPVPQTPTPEPTATPVRPTEVPSFTNMVDVGGYRLHFTCVGEGSPTVVLESDAGYYSDMLYWSNFLKQKPTDMGIRICLYNRSGIGDQGRHSDLAPNKPRTNMDMAVDLYNLLTNAGIEGPYIMVGNLMGGWIVRLFTDMHPDDVVGMVLIDGGHPDALTRALDLIPPAAADEHPALTAFRSYYIRLLDEPLKTIEYMDLKKSSEQLHAVNPIGDLPLVVLSHDTVDRTAQYAYIQEVYNRYGGDFPVDVYNIHEDDWALQMEELASLSTNSTFIMVEGSSFWLLQSQPESVVEAIRIVLDAVRSE